MSNEFEFALLGSTAPAGQLALDDWLGLGESLKAIARRLGRTGTTAEATGRAPQRVHRVSDLVIGLAPGSTKLMVQRSRPASMLDSDLADEQAFDSRFEAMVEGLAGNVRPGWMDDSLAAATGELALALRKAAPRVEFRVNGTLRQSFTTASINRSTWQATSNTAAETITFIGRLYAANVDTHYLQVRDDVGNRVSLPGVAEVSGIGQLLERYVVVTGLPRWEAGGQLSKILDAQIAEALDPLAGERIPDPVPLEQILAGAVSLEPGGIEGLTQEEFDSFYEAMGR